LVHIRLEQLMMGTLQKAELR